MAAQQLLLLLPLPLPSRTFSKPLPSLPIPLPALRLSSSAYAARRRDLLRSLRCGMRRSGGWGEPSAARWICVAAGGDSLIEFRCVAHWPVLVIRLGGGPGACQGQAVAGEASQWHFLDLAAQCWNLCRWPLVPGTMTTLRNKNKK